MISAGDGAERDLSLRQVPVFGAKRMEDVARIPAWASTPATLAARPQSRTDALERIASSTYAWPAFVGTIWFLVALVGVLWLWRGPEPLIFNSPDEATTQYASRLIAETGSVKAPLPISDEEDLTHLRAWISRGDTAIPALSPLTFYLYAAFLSIPVVGPLLIPLFASVGVGAFGAALALLGRSRRWVSLFAPAALFPGLYWLIRPWMNMSPYLSFVSMGLLLWLLWRAEHRRSFLFGAGAMLGLAVAVRPDYAGVTFGTAALCPLAELRRSEFRFALCRLALSLVEAAFLILLFNTLTTGAPLTFGYELAEAREAQGGDVAAARPARPGPLSEVYFLVLPNGVPAPSEVVRQIYKYWFQMWPAVLIPLSLPLASR